jgi:nucleotidyltransferase/DNA polymerase involved in DNA repair
MVKPPRTMQPEAVNLAKAGRAPGRAFQEDSFHNYMARKIDRQRQQFGALPPPPPPSAHVSFDRKASAEASAVRNDEALNDEALNDEALTVNDENSVGELPKTKRRKKKLAMASVLQHLKRRHGRVRKLKLAAADNHKGETETSLEETSFEEISFEGSGPVASSACLTQLPRYPAATLDEQQQQQEESWALSVANESPTIHAESPRLSPSKKRGRTDLFFTGVVVLINGYTHPDAESLQRLLQRHGGDVERYETTRVTHILAEHLSTAKAKVYANKRRSIPVVHPSWVVACVQEQRQLSHGPYLISEVRDLHQQPSVASFFQRQLPAAKEETPTLQVEDSEGIRERNCTGRRSDVLEGSEAKDKDRKGLAKDTKEKTSVAAEKIVKHGVEDEGNLTETACPVECTAKEIISGEAGGVSGALTAPPSRKQKGFVEVDGPAPKANDAARLSLHGGSHGNERTQEHSMAGRVRTVGTDPQFLESFFAASRLSFIGSFRQRTHGAGVGTANTSRVCDRPSKRFVLHVDMDSFFASVVLRKYPQYKDNPVAISHHGKSGPEEGEKGGKDSTSECATCNYHARRFGIKKGMFLGRARALCPSLIVLPYDFEGYEEVSEQVGEICHSHAAAHFGVIETVSCDESYMEVYVESVSVVTQLVQDIRREVEERTQCTASIGVARNKLLAKLATDRIKPNGWYVATDHLDLLRTLKLRELHGIGYRSGPKLTEKGLVSVRDVWDRGDSAAKELQTILGKQLGSKIYKFCQGIDDRPVQAVERKTIGAEVGEMCDEMWSCHDAANNSASLSCLTVQLWGTLQRSVWGRFHG